MPGLSYTPYSAWRTVRHRMCVYLTTTDKTDRTDCVLLGARQKPEKPLGEDGGLCPDVMLPLWSYKSELLTPKPKAYHQLLLEGYHPRQGDKQEKTFLSSGVLPSRQSLRIGLYPRALPPVTHGSALQAPECLRVLVMCLA